MFCGLRYLQRLASLIAFALMYVDTSFLENSLFFFVNQIVGKAFWTKNIFHQSVNKKKDKLPWGPWQWGESSFEIAFNFDL